jgi:hypothetical protein
MEVAKAQTGAVAPKKKKRWLIYYTHSVLDIAHCHIHTHWTLKVSTIDSLQKVANRLQGFKLKGEVCDYSKRKFP